MQPAQSQAFQPHMGQHSFRAGVKRPKAAAVEASGERHLLHGGGKVAPEWSLLRQVADFAPFQASRQAHPSPQGRLQTQQRFDQGAFARAVFACDAQVIPLRKRKINTFAHDPAGVPQRQVLADQLYHEHLPSLNPATRPSRCSHSRCSPCRCSIHTRPVSTASPPPRRMRTACGGNG